MKDIDKLQDRIKRFYDEYEQLQKNVAENPLDTKSANELATMEANKSAVDKVQSDIDLRKSAQTDLLRLNQEEEQSIQRLTNELIELTTSSEGNPIVDPDMIKTVIVANKALEQQLQNTTEDLRGQAKAAEDSATLFQSSHKMFRTLLKIYLVMQFSLLKRVLRESIQVIKELDKSFTEIAMVTTFSTKEVWAMKDAMVGLSETTGLTIGEVAKLSVEFFRQGRSMSETMKLVEAAGIAARLAGISTSDSVNYLTSAINAYRLSANQAMVVSDKFAALAAASATDYEELAIALSKVGAQAYSAGVNMDNMMGFIAKALEVTREAPEKYRYCF